MIFIKKLAVSTCLVVILFFSLKVNSTTFDILKVCESCNLKSHAIMSIASKAKGSQSLYSVLVIDAKNNKAELFNIHHDGNTTKVEQVKNKTQQQTKIITSTLKYYFAKHEIYSQLKQKVLAQQLSGNATLDCADPGVVYHNNRCQNIYFSLIKQRLLTKQVLQWQSTRLQLEHQIPRWFKHTIADSQYTQPQNIVQFTTPSATFIAFLLNDQGNGVIKMDKNNSVFSSRRALSYYDNSDKLKHASAANVNEYLSAKNCTTKLAITDTAIYSIKVDKKNQRYIQAGNSIKSQLNCSL